MFREELEDLKNVYLGRFSILHILGADAQDIDLFTGRLTAEKCAELFDEVGRRGERAYAPSFAGRSR